LTTKFTNNLQTTVVIANNSQKIYKQQS